MYAYLRMTPERLAQMVGDWGRLVEYYDELDEDEAVQAASKSIELFEFLLKSEGTPVSLISSEGTGIVPPDEEDRAMLDRYGELWPIMLSDHPDFFPDYITSADTVRIAEAMATPFDDLLARSDPAAMAAAGVKVTPDRGRRVDYDKLQYEALALQFRDAAIAGDGFITLYD